MLVGSTAYIHKPTIAFVRLNRAVSMSNVVEVPVPIRFIFILLGPLHARLDYHEVGRSIATLLSNKASRFYPPPHCIAFPLFAIHFLRSSLANIDFPTALLPPSIK